MAVGGGTRVRVGSWRARLGRARRPLLVAAGLLAAALSLLAAGELYLRVAPPGDLAEYMGQGSPRTGPFRPDDRYGAQYRSLEALADDNPGRFRPYARLFRHPRPPRLWAFFGNSFTQAPGMLADTAREYVPRRREFHLGKNEHLPIRLAQAEFLLDSGLPAERVFVSLIPLDGYYFAAHGLDQMRVTPGGGIAFAPRPPPVGGELVRSSRLALKAWVRTGLHENEPLYPLARLHDRYDGRILDDFAAVFGHLAKALARHRVPATVILLPDYMQMLHGEGFAFQDAVAPVLRGHGYDVFDAREAFQRHPDKPALFIPDKHYSPLGNRLLLAALVEHLRATDPASADLPDLRGGRP